MWVTWESRRTRVSPRVMVVFPAPESPATPMTTARANSRPEPLVPAAVEEQRLARPLARVLHPAEEQRVVAAPVRALHSRDEYGEGALDERGVLHEVEARLRQVVAPPAGEAVGQRRLRLAQHTHPVAPAL